MPNRRTTRWFLLLALTLPLLLGRCGGEDEPADRNEGYVGRTTCAECHEEAYDLWKGSDHDLAMQSVTSNTVLGDFNGVELTHFGVTSRFEREGQRYFVVTEGREKDELERFEVAYVFGHYPLQQYLVKFPDGRMQVLPLCWDSRSKEQGGQRWFHIYQDERILPDDPLYWMGPQQNWNYMCAECHSTNLQRHYDKTTDGFDTTWFEIDVSCEACHGPGKPHVAWAKKQREGDPVGDPQMAADISLAKAGFWVFDEGKNTADFVGERDTRAQLESCAPCHSRRYDLVHVKKVGVPYDDQYHLSLLREGLYHADGQILDEVYVYGSFLQSKMHGAGVSCTDCHDPHSAKVRSKGNELCAKCHKPEFYDRETHHHHEVGKKGSACVECHMPTTLYMVVDPRLDHSIRVPRPDLTLRIGTPNACNGCHDDQDAEWSQAAVEKWYGTETSKKGHFGIALQAGREEAASAPDLLMRLAEDETQVVLARATGVSLLAGYPSEKRDRFLVKILESEDPLLRRAAVEGFEHAPVATRLLQLPKMLQDPIRDVRLAAFMNLSEIPRKQVPERIQKLVDERLVEYMDFFESRADRADAWFGLANLHMSQGRRTEAESAFLQSLKRDPGFVRARANLADLYRQTRRELDCDRVLRDGLVPRIDTAPLYHALGLSLIRRKKYGEALQELAQAARLRPEVPSFVYAYALTLQQVGQPAKAVEVLEEARQRFPTQPQILLGLASAHEAQGQRSQALGVAQQLQRLYPREPEYRKLVQRLEGGR